MITLVSRRLDPAGNESSITPYLARKIECENAAHLFTRERFAQMQGHAVLINVTRGEIVRREDVLAALDEGL